MSKKKIVPNMSIGDIIVMYKKDYKYAVVKVESHDNEFYTTKEVINGNEGVLPIDLLDDGVKNLSEFILIQNHIDAGDVSDTFLENLIAANKSEDATSREMMFEALNKLISKK